MTNATLSKLKKLKKVTKPVEVDETLLEEQEEEQPVAPKKLKKVTKAPVVEVEEDFDEEEDDLDVDDSDTSLEEDEEEEVEKPKVKKTPSKATAKSKATPKATKPVAKKKQDEPAEPKKTSLFGTVKETKVKEFPPAGGLLTRRQLVELHQASLQEVLGDELPTMKQTEATIKAFEATILKVVENGWEFMLLGKKVRNKVVAESYMSGVGGLTNVKEDGLTTRISEHRRVSWNYFDGKEKVKGVINDDGEFEPVDVE